MATYTFSAFTEADLLSGSDSNLGEGDTFTMPATMSTQFVVEDNDGSLSGDNWYNEYGDDTSGQTADITYNGTKIYNDKKIYAEQYLTVRDQYGNTYTLIEIEVVNGDAPGTGDDFFAFFGAVPPAGAQLKVIDTRGYITDWIDYNQLSSGLGSLGGRLTYDSDANDNEWNDQTGAWDAGVGSATVKLIDASGNVVATTTTDAYGTYKFEGLIPGNYKVQFPVIDGKEFSAKDSGVDDHYDSDANANGLTDNVWVGANAHVWNVDAGVKTPLPSNNAPEAEDDAFVTDELTGVSGNVLANDSDPDGDAIAVVAVEGGTVGQSFQVTTAKGNTGTVTLQEDGSFTFDPGAGFLPLAQGETDSFDLTYTIADDPAVGGKHNILLVIDISNSTVGTSGQNVFNGTGVGDVNNDGRGDTVLDAQIVAARAMIADLRSKGLDPSQINIGIVTFSGVDTTGSQSYNNATVDSETLGTFSLDDGNLDAALTGILSGSWTNYEAGLSEAEDWFGDNAGSGDHNAMVFLSDGRPVTSYQNGQYVEQSTSRFLDEVARIETNYNADIHAIGVGSNSSLGILDQIDNTGGAIQVTDAASLTSAMLDIAFTEVLTDTATITVTINGLSNAPDALDDSITVFESEGAGDLETLDGGASSVLANDLEGSQPYDGQVVEVNGVAGNVGQWIDLAKGRVMINADGTVDFDADGDFDALQAGASEQVQVNYTIGGTGSLDGKLNYQFWNHVPSHNSIHNIPTSGAEYTGTVDDFDVNALALALTNDGDTYKIRYTGFVNIETGGSYSFTIGGDDGVGIWIDGNLVAERDGLHGFESATGSVSLGAGAHTVEVRFFENYGGQGLDVTMKGPDTGGVKKPLMDHVGSNLPVETDTATVTINVIGENEGPVALNDALTTDEATAKSINILANDSDPDGDAISITEIGGNAVGTAFQVTTLDGRTGTVTVQADGTLTFDPGTGFADLNNAETDSFQLTYTITDGQFTDTATVTVTVNGLGEPVDAVDDLYSIGETEGVIANVLDNDTPNDGSLSVVALAEDGTARSVGEAFTVTTDGGRTGTVTLNGDGTFTFNGNGNFIELSAGQTDTFDLTYTVEGAPTAGEVPKHNILFVVDISGSTSPAVFAGSPVGDQNGDGVANTVLDAEIAAYKALAAKIAESGLTDDKIDIGLVVFSGSNGSNQSNASRLLGTFKPGDAGLETALESLDAGGFTNFEAPLQVGIDWFDAQAATTDDKNIVYFLSDGMQNVGGSFDDESLELATRFGAELNAVGVGNNAVLEQLNVIDNTGGAEIVTTSDDLTAALVDTVDPIPGDQDTATITVVINGENDPPVAVDDALSVAEDETGSINILANDSDPNGDAISITTIAGNAPGTSFAVTTANGRTGTVTVATDGTLTFVPGPDFLGLIDGQNDSFTLGYEITDGQFTDTATVTVTVNGKGEPIEAIDDFLTVGEAQDVTPDGNPNAVVNGPEAFAANLLLNDIPQDGTIKVVALEAFGTTVAGPASVGSSFILTTDGGRQGQFTLNEDGIVTWGGLGNFIELAEGETDSFQIRYTIEKPFEEMPKHNLLFVLDISNSTVGQTGNAEDIFDGVGVGDVNGDGLADTVLDAEIAAVVSAITKLLDQGVDPEKVDVGIVTFSGLVDARRFISFNYPDEDATTVGTFQLDEQALIDELTAIQSGGWTNYEAGLQEAEQWLADNSEPGEVNKVYFLSDGRPVINTVNGVDILQDDSDYGDEVARIATNYNAELHAIGIGGNSDLDYLNDIDNTGGAEQVFDANELSAVLADNVTVLVQDDAILTVTLVGVENEPEAADDLLQTDEVTAKQINILTNDTAPGDQELCVLDVFGTAAGSGGGVGTGFMVTTAAGRSGMVTVQDDGTFDFDPMDGFLDLDQGQLDSFELCYVMGTGAVFGELSYEIYDGTPAGNTVDNIPTTGAVATGTVGDLDVGALAVATTGAANTYAIRYTGVINVETAGTYNFSLTSDDGSALFIDGVEAIDNDGLHPLVTNGSDVVLSAGQHEIEILFFQNEGGAGLGLTWSGPDTGGVASSILPSAASTAFQTAEAIVTVEVLGLATAPTANPDVLVTDEDTAASINILTNDTDPENDPLTVVSIDGGLVGDPITVTTAAGRTGTYTVLGDGSFTFDPAGGFEDLNQGDTDSFQITYAAGDGTGTDTSTITVIVNGLDDIDLLDDGDEASTVDEDAGLVTLTNVLDNADDPEPGEPVVARVDGSLGNLGNPVAGSNGGLFTIGSDGTATFDTNGEFDGLLTGQSTVSAITYDVTDAAGNLVTSTYTVTIVGKGELVDIEGVIVTDQPLTTAIAIVIDLSFEAVGSFLGTTPFDLNGDFAANTAVDYMISKVTELAATLSPDQEIALISQSLSPLVTVSAGAIQAALATGGDTGAAASTIEADDVPALQALFGHLQPLGGMLMEIDFAEVLTKAETYLLGANADNNEVVVMTASDGVLGLDILGEPMWSGANPQSVVSRLTNNGDPSNTDINVVYIDTADPLANISVLDQIDNELPIDVVDVIGDPGSENLALADLIDMPTVISAGDVLDITVDGVAQGTITDTADGAEYELLGLQIADGAVPEVIVRIDSDKDGVASAGDTLYNVTDLDLLERNGDTFSFTLDAINVA